MIWSASANSVKLGLLLHDISSIYRQIFQHDVLEHRDSMRTLTSTSVNLSFAIVNIQQPKSVPDIKKPREVR